MKLRSGKVKRDLSPSSRTNQPCSKKTELHASPIATEHLTSRVEQCDEALSTKNNEPSNSLSYTRLPAEIWLEICRLVVVKERGIYVRNKPINTIGKPLSELKTPLALASTCRWMYQVVGPIYYSRNTFWTCTHGAPDSPKRFFTAIRSSNVSLITSFEIEHWYQHSWEELPWPQVSAMTALRNFSVCYLAKQYSGLGMYAPGEFEAVCYDAALDYAKFIEYLDQCLNEEGERLRRITWTPTNFPSIKGTEKAVLDQQSWLSFERLNRKGGGLSVRCTYSWGSVGAAIYESALPMLDITVERQRSK